MQGKVIRWSTVGNAVMVFYFLADGLSVDGSSAQAVVCFKRVWSTLLCSAEHSEIGLRGSLVQIGRFRVTRF